MRNLWILSFCFPLLLVITTFYCPYTKTHPNIWWFQTWLPLHYVHNLFHAFLFLLLIRDTRRGINSFWRAAVPVGDSIDMIVRYEKGKKMSPECFFLQELGRLLPAVFLRSWWTADHICASLLFLCLDVYIQRVRLIEFRFNQFRKIPLKLAHWLKIYPFIFSCS